MRDNKTPKLILICENNVGNSYTPTRHTKFYNISIDMAVTILFP